LCALSRYTLGVLESKLGISIRIISDDREDYKFEYSDRTFELPAHFVNNEWAIFLERRSQFEYSLKKYSLLGDFFYGIHRENENPVKKTQYEIDIIGTIFVLLSRYEKQVLDEGCSDQFYRIQPEHTINFEALDRPIVDELVLLFEMLVEKELEIKIDKPKTEFNILPSHDVDRPFEYLYYTKKHLLKRLGGDLLVRKSLRKALKRTKLYSTVKRGNVEADPYNTFDWIINQSDKHKRTSTFHFIAGKTNISYDQDYELADPAIKELILSIHRRGHKVGLHPSFEASQIEGQVKIEFDTLKRFCSSIGMLQDDFKSRYHYLRWNKSSVNELEKAGVQVDQTLTFAKKVGFRCGTCHPYNAFNFNSMQVSELIIEPLIVMEQTLFSNSYMGLRNNMGEAWNIVSSLKGECRKHKGNFILLWHNNELIDQDMKEFYVQCIK
jgi:hypothetical protein